MSLDQSQPSRPSAREGAICLAVGRFRAELLLRSPYDAAYTPELAIIGFAFERQTGIHAFATDRRTRFQAKPNGLAYVPGGCDVYSASEQGGEYLKITLEPEHDASPCHDQRFSDLVDPVAIRAAQRLRAMLLASDQVDPVMFEQFVQTLQMRVACVHGGQHAEARESAWMTVHRRRQIDEMIETRLDKRLTVQELAGELGLSTGFFSRALKAAIGQSPHDYIIERRIARVRSLLKTRVQDLSAIALASGFVSHAHMSATFRSRLGVTPSQIRSSLIKAMLRSGTQDNQTLRE
jgi:AraC family transcriptional regulator